MELSEKPGAAGASAKRRRLTVDESDEDDDGSVADIVFVGVRTATGADPAKNKKKRSARKNTMSAANLDDVDLDEEKHLVPQDPVALPLEEESDPDFEYLVRHVQPVESTTRGTRKRAKQVSLRAMLESGKKNYDLPRPRQPDPIRRAAKKPVHKPRHPELVPARWPAHVLQLADNYNPTEVPIPGVPPFQKCSCHKRGDCRFGTCENANVHVYCDASCCPYFGVCGNGTSATDALQLMRVKNTDVYTIQASTMIPKGVIIGEYIGIVSLVPRDVTERVPNEGYRLHYHPDRDVWGSQVLCVDANLGGSLMRFLNHSCEPSAVFHEVANASGRIMVVRTCREIEAGEEVSVDYGDDLWFVCKCAICEEKSRRQKKEPKRK